MDFRDLHKRFRLLFADVVESRRRPGRHDDWIVECYDSYSVFEGTFRNRVYCEEWLKEREANHAATRQILSEELAHLTTNGLGYSEVEEMNRVIPRLHD